jgi:hypothetical protein
MIDKADQSSALHAYSKNHKHLLPTSYNTIQPASMQALKINRNRTNFKILMTIKNERKMSPFNNTHPFPACLHPS